MKKWYRKGQLYKRGKRSLALLLSACLIGTMIPVTARAESSSINTGLCEHHTEHTTECGYVAPVEGHECEHVHDDSCGYQEASECNHVHTEECGENGENCTHAHTSECGYAEGHACEHVHDEECGYVESSEGSPCTYVCENCAEEAKRDKNTGSDETLAQTTDKLITAWQWIDEDEYLDEETGNLALPGASEEMPAHFDDITALLPTQIQATVENAENTEAEAVAETITLGDWVCEDYPKDGAYSGSYTFTATLPEGYALSEETKALEVLVELGGAEMYDDTVETPTFSVEDGSTFEGSQEITISCATEGAAIYYTLDGSEPSSETGKQYSAPITIQVTTTIKAIAVKDQMADSAVASATCKRTDVQLSGYCGKEGDNLKWVIDSEGTLTISGQGEMVDEVYGIWYMYSESKLVKKIVIQSGVTSLGKCAFRNCELATEITIPDTVTSIGECAFQNCSTIENITIPENVTSIGISAFRGCTNLKTIAVDSGNNVYKSEGNCIIEKATNKLIAGCKASIIPNTVTSIGAYAFSDMPIESISLPDSITSIGSAAFTYTNLTEIALPSSLKQIDESAFSYCKKLTKVNIPESVESIGQWAFGACYDLGQVSFSDDGTLKTIGYRAFTACKITTITIPASVENMGERCFNNCKGLTTVNIADGSGLNTIGDAPFDNCTALTTITMKDNGTFYTANDCLFEKNEDGSVKRLIYGFEVTLPTDEGYTIAAEDENSRYVGRNGSFSFTVTPAAGYNKNVVVKANSSLLTAENGVYAISNITANQKVTLVGAGECTHEEATFNLVERNTKHKCSLCDKVLDHQFVLDNENPAQHKCSDCGYAEAHAEIQYQANDSAHTISASCSECGDLGTITLAAPAGDLSYTGEAKAATVSGAISGITTPDITYAKSDGTNLGTTAPIYAGTYTASIMLGEGDGAQTVSVEFTIEKATPDIGTVSAQELENTLAASQVQLSRSVTTVDGTLSLVEGTTLQYGSNNYTYIFTPNDTDNYKSVTGSVTVMVKDTIDPTAEYKIGVDGWKQFVNTISFGLFCKDYKTVEITYSDVNASVEQGSGVKTKQYYIANKELAEAEIAALEWNNYSDTISLNAEGVYFIYVKVEDNAGNSVVLNSEGIVIYADSALSPESMDYTYKENKDLEVQVTMNGNTFGKLTDGAGTEIAAENYTIDEAGKLTLKAAYLDTLNVGEYTYKVYMNPQGQTTDTVTLTYSFVVNIKACELTVTGATATARKYDTTNVVNITAVELNGIKGTDDVSVNTTSLTGTLTGANVGNYTSVTLPALTLTGTVAGNYTLVQPTGAVPTNVTISKADAEITIDTGKDSYSKTFGNADFTLSGISDTNTEADVQYAVTAGDDVVSVSNGTVTILNAGTATITVSLPASTNYNAADSKTITVTVEKKSGYTVADINKSYLYSRDNAENIDLSKYLPSNCGTVSYGTPQVNEGLYTDGGQPEVSSDGKLSYTVKTGSVGDNGTIKVAVTTVNYADFTITVNVNLTDKLPVSLKGGASVTLQNSILTYGQTLSTLAFNSAVFVNDGGNVVAGTLAWKTPDEKPNAGTTSATWIFTPDDEAYATVEDTVAITVNKATPNVTALPTVAARTYHPTASLTNADLVGGTVTGIDGNPLDGSWSWQTAGIIPTANNTGYVAVFTPTDTANYNTVTQTITVAVSKVTPYIATAPTAVAITYGDTLGDSALTGHTVQYSASDMTAVSGSFAWKDSSVKPSVSDSDITAYRVVFNPSDTENYNTAETDITLTVNKADNAPNMPSSTMNVANSCEKVSDVTLPTGWVWQDADKDTALAVDTPVTATAEYNGADKGNYVNETVSVTITRSACDHVHTEIRNAKEATCKETGYTGDTYCTDCGALLSTGTTIPLADHQGGTATCTKKAVCTVCGKEYGTLDANNHANTEIKGAVAATCTAGGYTGDTYCTDCGVKTKTGTVTPVLGHSYTGKVTTEPTTEKEGVRTYTCERCGHSYTESIPKLPEQSHAHFHIGTVSKAATCTENGVTIYSCSCGDSYTETIPALGHHYISRVTKQPTTGSEGVMTYTCDRCVHSFTRAIAKLQDTNSTKPTSNKPASSNTANSNPGDNNSGDNNSEENNPEDNKPDTGKPYIKDENGKEGWDVIKDEVDKTKDGDTVTVEMNGTSVVPGDVLDDIKGKDVTIVFDMGGGITWSVNGKSITADRVGDIDFTVKADTNTIPMDIINNVTGERYSKQISLSYDGEFGFTAVLSVNMDSGNAGLYANLFYYNEKTGEMELICCDEIAEDGTAELTFTHASDYAIIIDREPMGEIAQVDSPASESQDTETETTQPDAEANDDAWNPWWIIIIGIAVIVIGLGVFFVVKKKKSGAE